MRLLIIGLLSSWGLALASGAVGAAPQPLEIADSGAFKLAGVRCQLVHYGPGWESSGTAQALRADAGYPKRDAGAFEVRGNFSVRPFGSFHVQQTIRPTAPGRYAFSAQVSSAQPVASNVLCLSIALPVDPYAGESLTIDGKPVELPREGGEPTVLNKGQVRKMVIPAGGGNITIDGPADVLLQDNRRWGGQDFSIRINFTPANGDIAQAALKLAFGVPADVKPLQKPVTIVAGDQWRPYQHEMDVEAGSILDFSGLLDAPAGKYGRVIAKDGHFAFENRPRQPVRFYGANLCFSANFPTHEQAEKMADRLARMGYNTVRLHHYDGELSDPKAADSVTLQKDQLDRIEYFISALKKRGIYISIDLYTFRQTRANEIPEIGKPVRAGYKALVPILDSAMSNWQAFARNLLTHRNPYTGLTWAEDPILIGICPLNEDALGITYHETPEVAKLYDQRFAAWLKQQNLAPSDASARDAALCRFLTETQLDANRRITAFLRGLGVKTPLTGVNCVDAASLTPIRAEFDYVDNHAYWDHPGFPEKPWSLPESFGNTSAITAGADVPRRMMPTRIIGKPFTVTEFNYCMPNRYRAEGGPLIGAYAALQNWDGLWRFAWSHDIRNTQKPVPAAGFDIGIDPLSLLSDRIAVLQFLRGDVSPGRRMISFEATPKTAYTRPAGWGAPGFGEQAEFAGLYTQVGSAWHDPAAVASPGGATDRSPRREPWEGRSEKGLSPVGAVQPLSPGESPTLTEVPPDALDIPNRHVVSDTGQIELAGKAGTFRVVTPRSESFTMLQAGELTGKVASVKTDSTATIAVAAMDGKDLPTSGRLLIFHLTDVQNTGITYAGRSMTLLEKWGDLPHLVRAGKATLRLNITGPATATLYPLDAAGRRQKPIELQHDGDTLIIPLDTTAGPTPALAYELLRQ